MSEPLLKVRGVQTFYGKIQALKGIDMDVNDGEIVTLIGSCLLYTSPSPRDRQKSRMPSSA